MSGGRRRIVRPGNTVPGTLHCPRCRLFPRLSWPCQPCQPNGGRGPRRSLPATTAPRRLLPGCRARSRALLAGLFRSHSATLLAGLAGRFPVSPGVAGFLSRAAGPSGNLTGPTTRDRRRRARPRPPPPAGFATQPRVELDGSPEPSIQLDRGVTGYPHRVCQSSASYRLRLHCVGREGRSRKSLNASLLRRVGPEKSRDLGLRAVKGTEAGTKSSAARSRGTDAEAGITESRNRSAAAFCSAKELCHQRASPFGIRNTLEDERLIMIPPVTELGSKPFPLSASAAWRFSSST